MSKMALIGHRPNKLYGEDIFDERYDKLRNIVNIVINVQNSIDTIDTFITGGALGFDMLAFKECLGFSRGKDIKNVLAIPFDEQAKDWDIKSQHLYNDMKNEATECIYVDKLENYKLPSNEKDNCDFVKIHQRNKYMVDNCDVLVACWDGEKIGGTYDCVEYARSLNKKVVIIEPDTFNVYNYN